MKNYKKFLLFICSFLVLSFCLVFPVYGDNTEISVESYNDVHRTYFNLYTNSNTRQAIRFFLEDGKINLREYMSLALVYGLIDGKSYRKSMKPNVKITNRFIKNDVI